VSSPAEIFADVPARFKLVNALPAAFFICLMGALVLSGPPTTEPSFSALLDQSRGFGWLGAAAAVVAVALGALMLEPFELASVRWLEGYWPSNAPMARLSELGRWVQARKRDRLQFTYTMVPDVDAKRDAARERQDLPSTRPLLPTSLGNRLRAFEEKAGKQYGIDAIYLWPRLYYIIPEEALSYINGHRNQLDTACRLCLTFALSSGCSALLVLRFPIWWFLPVALAIASALSYRGALAAVSNYSVAVTAAIDVYRLRLLQEMHIEMPRDTDEERVINDALKRLWRRDHGASVKYALTDTDMTVVIKDLHRLLTARRSRS
jgi:hypothetical protein